MSTVFVSLSGITFFLKSSSRILNLRFSLESWILQASYTSAWWRTWVDFWVFSKFLFGPGTRQWQGTLKYLASNGKIQSLSWNFFRGISIQIPWKCIHWDVWSRASLGHLDRVFKTFHSNLGQCSWCRQPARRQGWSSSSEPGRMNLFGLVWLSDWWVGSKCVSRYSRQRSELAVLLFGNLFYWQHFRGLLMLLRWWSFVIMVFFVTIWYDDDVHRSRTFLLKSRHKLGHLVAGKDALLNRNQPVPSFVVMMSVMMMML